MQNSVFYDLFNDLSQEEAESFIHYFKKLNQSADAYTLLKYLHTHKDNPKLDQKKWLFTKIFPTENYNDQKLRHLLFILNHALENYLYQHNKKEFSFEKEFFLLEYYRKRKLYKRYLKTHKALSIFVENDIQSSNKYIRKYLISQSYNKFIKAKQIRTIEPKLQEVSDSLDMFYISQKLFILLEASNYKRMINVEYEIDYITDMLPLISKNKKQDHPLINTTIFAINTINDIDNIANFDMFIKQFELHKTLFDDELIDDFLIIAKNYCIKKINSGENSYTNVLFNLYKEELLQDQKKYKHEMTPASYKNIISTAFSLNEYDWAKDFIENNTQHLPLDLQHSYRSYNLARYHFHYKEYDIARTLLMDVEYSDFFIMFNAKAIELKTYYELQEWSILDSLLKSFNMLLRNKQAVAYHKEYYENFILTTNKLKNIQLEINKPKKKAALSKLRIAEKTIDKNWILEKIETLRSSLQ